MVLFSVGLLYILLTYQQNVFHSMAHIVLTLTFLLYCDDEKNLSVQT